MSWRNAVAYFLFTGIAGVPLAFILCAIPLFLLFGGLEGAGATMESLMRRRPLDLTMVMTFSFNGLNEEIWKASPLLIFGLRRQQIHSARDGILLGLVSGAGFGVMESLLAAISSTASLKGILLQSLTRTLAHASFAGVSGWFIGLASQRPRPRWPLIVTGILLAALFHTLANIWMATRSTPRYVPEIASALLVLLLALRTHILTVSEKLFRQSPQP